MKIIIFIILLICIIINYINLESGACKRLQFDKFENINSKFTIISNTCVGYRLLKEYNKTYDNPFIGLLIINDYDYIKLSNNFFDYINYEPQIIIPKSNLYYNHKDIEIPYPVILLKDIELHYIHENNNNVVLEKYNRRIQRYKKILNNKIFITLSFSEFLNNHNNYQILIDEFLENNNTNNIIKLFLGPPEYYKKNIW
jgi:uncharacterized protein (DUF1919 family)